jgi:endonuclease IV
MYRVSVSETAVSTPEKEHSLGSNVVRLETERQQLEITQAGARPDLQGTGTDSQAYDLDAIRSAVHASYPIENRGSYDQKAA